jgi:hypothetical protein
MLPKGQGRDWNTNLLRALNNNKEEFFRLLTTSTCSYISLAGGAAIQKLMRRMVITTDDNDPINSVEIIGVQMRPELVHPIVRCYCDPNIAPQDVRPEDMDPVAGEMHQILRFTSTSGKTYALDLSAMQYGIEVQVRPMRFEEYLRRYTVGQTRDVFSPITYFEENDGSRMFELSKGATDCLYSVLLRMKKSLSKKNLDQLKYDLARDSSSGNPGWGLPSSVRFTSA